MGRWWNDNKGARRKYSEKKETFPRAISSTTNHTRTTLASNPETTRLDYGIAPFYRELCVVTQTIIAIEHIIHPFEFWKPYCHVEKDLGASYRNTKLK
jgi:hypothetical protein